LRLPPFIPKEEIVQKTILAISLSAAALLWVVVSAQQEMLPRPGPGSGVTSVTGSVSIANTPNVRATQDGDWRVAVANTPSVRVTEVPAPAFLHAGSTYEIIWTDGYKEIVTVASIAANGWIEVERGRRWINPASARSISENR
jgi:hypothetical protein